MSKVAVVYWSGTGNTQAMADAVQERCKAAGAELVSESVISNDAPGDEETESCRKLGAALA